MPSDSKSHASPEAYGRALFTRYEAKPLSDHIAKPTAIAGLARWVRRSRPRHVVEVGAGIGTLTHCLVEIGSELEPAPRVDAVEPWAPCLEVLRSNLQTVRAASRCALRLYGELEALEELDGFDFLVVDGGTEESMRAVRRLARGGTIFVEGDRLPQRNAILSASEGRCVVWSQFITAELKQRRGAELARDAQSSPFEGGFSVFRVEPSLLTRLEFFGYRLQMAWIRRWVRPRRLRALRASS